MYFTKCNNDRFILIIIILDSERSEEAGGFTMVFIYLFILPCSE